MKKLTLFLSLVLSTSVYANATISTDKTVSIEIDGDGDLVIKSDELKKPDTTTNEYFANLGIRTFPMKCDDLKHEGLGAKLDDEIDNEYLVPMSDHCITDNTKSVSIKINGIEKTFKL